MSRVHLDTLSRQRAGQDEKRESETTMTEHVTIREAARRCGVSDKTVQRAIQAGTLPARYPQPNRCEIAMRDLERMLPGHLSRHSPEPLEQRVAELEQRVQQLEHQVAELLTRPTVPKPQRRVKTQERMAGPLPTQFVPLLAFARHHNVAESKVQTHAGMGLLPVKRGNWTDVDGTVVALALDAQGRAAFSQLYHGVPPFVECKQCPH